MTRRRYGLDKRHRWEFRFTRTTTGWWIVRDSSTLNGWWRCRACGRMP